MKFKMNQSIAHYLTPFSKIIITSLFMFLFSSNSFANGDSNSEVSFGGNGTYNSGTQTGGGLVVGPGPGPGPGINFGGNGNYGSEAGQEGRSSSEKVPYTNPTLLSTTYSTDQKSCSEKIKLCADNISFTWPDPSKNCAYTTCTEAVELMSNEGPAFEYRSLYSYSVMFEKIIADRCNGEKPFLKETGEGFLKWQLDENERVFIKERSSQALLDILKDEEADTQTLALSVQAAEIAIQIGSIIGSKDYASNRENRVLANGPENVDRDSAPKDDEIINIGAIPNANRLLVQLMKTHEKMLHTVDVREYNFKKASDLIPKVLAEITSKMESLKERLTNTNCQEYKKKDQKKCRASIEKGKLTYTSLRKAKPLVKEFKDLFAQYQEFQKTSKATDIHKTESWRQEFKLKELIVKINLKLSPWTALVSRSNQLIEITSKERVTCNKFNIETLFESKKEDVILSEDQKNHFRKLLLYVDGNKNIASSYEIAGNNEDFALNIMRNFNTYVDFMASSIFLRSELVRAQIIPTMGYVNNLKIEADEHAKNLEEIIKLKEKLENQELANANSFEEGAAKRRNNTTYASNSYAKLGGLIADNLTVGKNAENSFTAASKNLKGISSSSVTSTGSGDYEASTLSNFKKYSESFAQSDLGKKGVLTSADRRDQRRKINSKSAINNESSLNNNKKAARLNRIPVLGNSKVATAGKSKTNKNSISGSTLSKDSFKNGNNTQAKLKDSDSNEYSYNFDSQEYSSNTYSDSNHRSKGSSRSPSSINTAEKEKVKEGPEYQRKLEVESSVHSKKSNILASKNEINSNRSGNIFNLISNRYKRITYLFLP